MLRPVFVALALALPFLLACLTNGQQVLGRVEIMEKGIAAVSPRKEGSTEYTALLEETSKAAAVLKKAVDFLEQAQASPAGPTSEAAVCSKLLEQAEKQYQHNIEAREPLIAKFNRSKNLGRAVGPVMLVPTYPCIQEVRVGDWWDGGKWICTHHLGRRPGPTAISIGSNGETSFEKEFSTTLGGFSHVLDFTLTPQQQERLKTLPYLKFYNMGLAGEKDIANLTKKFSRFKDAKIVGIKALLDIIGETSFDVFKIDCEGCELGVVEDLKRLYTRETIPFGQVQMEIHRATNREEFFYLLDGLESLGYRLFHVEPNFFFGGHYEIAYIHEKLTKPA